VSLSLRKTLAMVVGVSLIMAALLATSSPAGADTIYACKKPNGTLRIVSKATRCKRRQKKLSWNTQGPAGANGANGSNGSNGANGQNGARGPAGAFLVVDQAGRTLGLYAGFGPFGILAYTESGVLLSYDNVPTTNYPGVFYATLYYKVAGCAGPAYTNFFVGSLGFEAPIVLASPPTPGSQIYSAIPANAPESFTWQSRRTASGCTNDTGSVTLGYQVTENGTVPLAQEPLMLVPLD